MVIDIKCRKLQNETTENSHIDRYRELDVKSREGNEVGRSVDGEG